MMSTPRWERISFLRGKYQPSIARSAYWLGVKIIPKVKELDFSGCRSGLALITVGRLPGLVVPDGTAVKPSTLQSRLLATGALLTGAFGLLVSQRRLSKTRRSWKLWKDSAKELPICEIAGARKPVAAVPRKTISEGSAVHLKPALPVVLFTKSS